MDRAARGRGWPRWAAVCTLLLGLFLMHGAPMAADGCHDATAAVLPMAHPASSVLITGSPTPAAAEAARAHQVADTVAASCTDSTMCVSTPPSRATWLSAVLLLAVFVLARYAPPSAAWAGMRGRAQRRGPPEGGRELLLRVCVART